MVKEYFKDCDYSYALGLSLTFELINKRSKDVRIVYISNKIQKNEVLIKLLRELENKHIDYEYDDEVFKRLSLKENCYCIGVFRKFYSKINNGNHIVLYGFNNYGDLGTILRSSVSFDFKDIVIVNSDLDYFNPSCVRASMGSIFHTNIVKYTSIEDYLKDFPDQNLIPFTSNGKTELKKTAFKKPFSIIISEQYNGLDNIFSKGYYLNHNEFDEISLSIRSSIILSEAFYQIGHDKNI